jgi:hypothetical protein
MKHATQPSFEVVQDYAYSLFLFVVPESYTTAEHGIASVRTTTGHTLECWIEPNGSIYGEY